MFRLSLTDLFDGAAEYFQGGADGSVGFRVGDKLVFCRVFGEVGSLHFRFFLELRYGKRRYFECRSGCRGAVRIAVRVLAAPFLYQSFDQYAGIRDWLQAVAGGLET